jgi:hypothetical protein
MSLLDAAPSADTTVSARGAAKRSPSVWAGHHSWEVGVTSVRDCLGCCFTGSGVVGFVPCFVDGFVVVWGGYEGTFVVCCLDDVFVTGCDSVVVISRCVFTRVTQITRGHLDAENRPPRVGEK